MPADRVSSNINEHCSFFLHPLIKCLIACTLFDLLGLSSHIFVHRSVMYFPFVTLSFLLRVHCLLFPSVYFLLVLSSLHFVGTFSLHFFTIKTSTLRDVKILQQPNRCLDCIREFIPACR